MSGASLAETRFGRRIACAGPSYPTLAPYLAILQRFLVNEGSGYRANSLAQPAGQRSIGGSGTDWDAVASKRKTVLGRPTGNRGETAGRNRCVSDE